MKTIYEKAQGALSSQRGEKISLYELRKLITIKCGGDSRTINHYLKMMQDMNLIKDIGNMHFEIL